MIFNPQTQLNFIKKQVSLDKKSCLSPGPKGSAMIQQLSSQISSSYSTGSKGGALIESKEVQEEILKRSVFKLMSGKKETKDSNKLWFPNLENKCNAMSKFSGSPAPKRSGNMKVKPMGKNVAENRRISLGNFIMLKHRPLIQAQPKPSAFSIKP